MDLLPIVPLYVGPDQLLPLTSALGAVTGILLIFWNQVKILAKKVAAFFAKLGGFGKQAG
jgi:hypothetical protein